MTNVVALTSRFKFLDFMKGIALVLILWAHLGMWWDDGSWTSAQAFAVVFIIRPFGPSNFVFASIFGFLLSIEKRENEASTRAIRVRLSKRSAVYIGIGSILNLINYMPDVLEPGVPLFAKVLRVLLTCNIFTFLGLAQIIAFAGHRLKAGIQVAIISAVFASYFLLMMAIAAECKAAGVDYVHGDIYLGDISSPVATLYFLLAFENSMAPFLPYIAIIFIVNLTYRRMIALLARPEGTDWQARLGAEARRVARWSLMILASGVLVGIMPSPGLFNQVEYSRLVHDDPFRVWDPTVGGYPLFLHSSNPGYILFSFGIVSMLVLGGIWFIDLRPARKRNEFIDFISIFGSYSLTVFITHAIASFFQVHARFLSFFLLYGLVTSTYLVVIYFWDKKVGGRFSIEWFLKTFLSTDVLARLGRGLPNADGESSRHGR